MFCEILEAKGVLRTMWNIFGGVFFEKIVNHFKPLKIFAEKLHHRLLIGF